MARIARSTRGQMVNFDLLSIKDQLGSLPAPVFVKERRQFIDEKEGLVRKQVNNIVDEHGNVSSTGNFSDALLAAAELIKK